MSTPAKATRNRGTTKAAGAAARSVQHALRPYKAKRNFTVTAEPSGDETPTQPPTAASTALLSFVIQKHWASSLHYDLRLEIDGTMKSWAVPKGPSLDPKDKRLAVQVEDHPMSYSSFEGTIPAGQYGAGRVIVWDKGAWIPMVDDAQQAYADGHLKFTLQGHKLRGNWALVRMGDSRGAKQPPWLLIKEKDEFARPSASFNVVEALPDSVGKTPPHTASALAPNTDTGRPQSRHNPRLAAPAAPLPSGLKPQLAVLVERPPEVATQWIYEIKYDGYRLLTRVDKTAVQLFTRTGKDWSHKLPALRQEVKRLQLPSGWYDGEIVVQDPATGRPNFAALQDCMDSARSGEVVLHLFDLPYFDGKDLRQQPLHVRRAVLEKCLQKAPASSRVRFSQAFDEDTGSLLASACKLGLEGIVGKRKDSPYVSRRSPDWIKLKCQHRQEFVIGGYTAPQGSRADLGALLLGVFNAKGALHYAGKVGTGFTTKTLHDLVVKLKSLASQRCPFADPDAIEGRPHWVKPVLVAEVAFQEWTPVGRIRQGVFHGLRVDKEAHTIVREEPTLQPRSATMPKAPDSGIKPPPQRAAAPHITHAERIIDAKSGTTKGDLVDYYQQVADLILVHVQDRPTAVIRAPSGVGGELFFQKHVGAGTWPGIQAFAVEDATSANGMLNIRGVQGLLSAAQWNVVEFHTANVSGRALQRPDRMVLDLDPGEGVQWTQLQEAATLVHAFLEQLELKAFLKTSGGKGLHVVVPLRRVHDWATVKGVSQAIVQHLSQHIPQRFVAKSGPRNRVGKIFIDYLRNGEGSTTASAWTARARAGMGISVPLAWDELDKVHSGDHWTVATASKRLAIGNTPWEGYAQAICSLAVARERLGYKPAG